MTGTDECNSNENHDAEQSTMRMDGLKSYISTNNYYAAVVEMNADSADSENDVRLNVGVVISIISSSELKKVDIIVFPEIIINTANTALLLPAENIEDFINTPSIHPLLKAIAVAVLSAQKYVVIGLYAKVRFEDDNRTDNYVKYTKNGIRYNIYNMALVFGPNGHCILRYKKFNLFAEAGVQHPENPELKTFHTHWGVEFGVCICFDLLHYHPLFSLLRLRIKHLIYPTFWFSETPFLPAVPVQQMFAMALGFGVLAANSNQPTFMESGSGIYSGNRGALRSIVSHKQQTTVLVAKVPKHPVPISEQVKNEQGQDLANQPFLEPLNWPKSVTIKSNKARFLAILMGISRTKFGSGLAGFANAVKPGLQLEKENLEKFNMTHLDFSANIKQERTVCIESSGIKFCCHYDIEVQPDTSTKKSFFETSTAYYVVVTDKPRKYAPIDNLRSAQYVCGVIACAKKGSCKTLPSNYPYTFKKLILKTKFPPQDHLLVMPNTVDGELYPFKSAEFTQKIGLNTTDNLYDVELKLEKERQNLLTFAIYARDYKRDVITDAPQVAHQNANSDNEPGGCIIG